MYLKNFILSNLRARIKYYRRFSSQSTVADVEVPFSNGSTLKLSTGRFARFADGACVATFGNTSVLATVVSKAKPSTSNFLPLVVDYRQKAAAAGRIPTNFLRRELGPSEHEILTSRLIDRSLRPLFPNNYNYDTQIVCNMLAMDGTNLPETVAINAASTALTLSDVPWNGPVGAVRIGQIDGELIVNPTRKELESSTLNLVVSATRASLVVMLEGSAGDVLQPELLKAIKLGTKEAQHIVRAIENLQNKHGRMKREYETQLPLEQSIVDSVHTLSTMKIREILSDYSHDKTSRDIAVSELRQTVTNQLRDSADVAQIQDCFNDHLRLLFREMIFETDTRCDGRKLDDLRNISCEVGLYEPLHGSALFQRGQTQVLCTVAFDSPDSALKVDPLTMLTSGIKEKSFFLHYEFPSYATGETGRGGGGPGRREAGHGALAERGLRPVVPHMKYAVRLTAEVLESNGSSSMAAVCGGSLALCDAGVPLARAAAGVAVGLVSRPVAGGLDYRILTDLLGIEDYMGDMDFKLAGTKKGITALQADIKIPGLPLKIVMESVQKACDAKSKIIDIMNQCIDKPREGHKENMPVLEEMEVDAHKRSKLLGLNGSNLKKLYVETGVQISPIDETKYSVFAPTQAAMDEARVRIATWINTERTPELEFGAIYKAKVVEVREIGVLVTLFPGMQPALVHNSQLDHRKIQHPSVLGLEEGSEIQVKYFGRDPVSGQVRLSRKVLTSPPPGVVRKLDKN